MKKIAIASAVAAAMISGSASAAEAYGNIRIELQSQEEMALDSGKLVFGFKGEEDLGNGMSALYHVEFEHDDTDVETTGLSNDRSYVGLKGDWGQVIAGVVGDAAGFACGATDIFVNNSDLACALGVTSNGAVDNAILYTNSFDAFTVALGVTFDGDLGDDPLGLSGPSTATSQVDGGNPAPGNHTIFGFQYDGGMWSVGAQITSPDDDLGAEDATVIGGSVKIGPGTLGLALGDSGADDDNDATDIAYAMPLGGGTFKIGLSSGDALDAGKGDTTNVQWDTSLSKSVYTGVQYSDPDNADDALIEGWLGYKF